MSNVLKISLVIFSLFMFCISFIQVRKGRIPIKYSLIWIFISFALFILGIFPWLIEFTAKLVGIETLSSLIISIILTLLLIITLILTIIVSNQKKLIRLLIQEVSLLKSKN